MVSAAKTTSASTSSDRRAAAGARGERLLVAGAGGSAEMAHQHNASALPDELLDRWKSSPDAGVVGHHAVFDGHVEVNAHEDALPPCIEFVNRFDLSHVLTLS